MSKANKKLSQQNLDEIEIISLINQVYADSYMDSLCSLIGSKDEREKEHFVVRIRRTGEQYLNLKRSNVGRISPSAQNKLFDDYKKGLKRALKAHRAIQMSTAASGKLGKAVREKYQAITNETMKEMFNPYYNSTSMHASIFEDFLALLIEAAGNAENQDVGQDKADISGILLTEWIAAIVKAWPQDATVKFSLGEYDSMYTSRSVTALHDIVKKIEPEISDKYIQTVMRTISLENLLDQPIANFFVI